MKTCLSVLFICIGMTLYAALPLLSAARPSRRASHHVAIPSVRQAIIKAIETSGGYSLFDWETGVSGIKQRDGTVQVRFVQYVTNYQTHTYDKSQPHALLLVSFSRKGMCQQLLDKGAIHRGPHNLGTNSRICKAVARAYSYYLHNCGNHTDFDVQAEAFTPEALSFPWNGKEEKEKSGYHYKYLVSIMPYEPGSRFHFRLSRSYTVLGVLPGT